MPLPACLAAPVTSLEIPRTGAAELLEVFGDAKTVAPKGGGNGGWIVRMIPGRAPDLGMWLLRLDSNQ